MPIASHTLCGPQLSANAKKLRLCRKKLQAARREIKQLQEDYDDERATYLKEAEASQNREANFEKELGLLRLIVDGFVPPRFQQQIRARATFDEVTSSWHLPGLTLAGNHASAQAVTGPTPRRQRLHGRGVDLNLPMDVHVASTKVRRVRFLHAHALYLLNRVCWLPEDCPNARSGYRHGCIAQQPRRSQCAKRGAGVRSFAFPWPNLSRWARTRRDISTPTPIIHVLVCLLCMQWLGARWAKASRRNFWCCGRVLAAVCAMW